MRATGTEPATPSPRRLKPGHAGGITLLEMIFATAMMSGLLVFYLEWSAQHHLQQRAETEAANATNIVQVIRGLADTSAQDSSDTMSDVLGKADAFWPDYEALTAAVVNPKQTSEGDAPAEHRRLRLLGKQIQLEKEGDATDSDSDRPVMRGLLRVWVAVENGDIPLARRTASLLRRQGIPAGYEQGELVIWVSSANLTLARAAMDRGTIGTGEYFDEATSFDLSGITLKITGDASVQVAAGHHVDGTVQRAPFDYRIHADDPINHPRHWRWQEEGVDQDSWPKLAKVQEGRIKRLIEDGLPIPKNLVEGEHADLWQDYQEDIRIWKQLNDRATPHLHYSAGVMRGYSGWGWFPCTDGSTRRRVRPATLAKPDDNTGTSYWRHKVSITHRPDQCVLGSVAMSRDYGDLPSGNTSVTIGGDSVSVREWKENQYGGLYAQEAIVIAAGGTLASSPGYRGDETPDTDFHHLYYHPYIVAIPFRNSELNAEKARRLYTANNIGDSWSGRCFGMMAKFATYNSEYARVNTSDREEGWRRNRYAMVGQPNTMSTAMTVGRVRAPKSENWIHPAVVNLYWHAKYSLEWDYNRNNPDSGYFAVNSESYFDKPHLGVAAAWRKKNDSEIFSEYKSEHDPLRHTDDPIDAAMSVANRFSACEPPNNRHEGTDGQAATWDVIRSDYTVNDDKIYETQKWLPIAVRYYTPPAQRVKVNEAGAESGFRIYPLGQFYAAEPNKRATGKYSEFPINPGNTSAGEVPEGGVVHSYGGAFNITGMLHQFGRRTYTQAVDDYETDDAVDNRVLDPRHITHLNDSPAPWLTTPHIRRAHGVGHWFPDGPLAGPLQGASNWYNGSWVHQAAIALNSRNDDGHSGSVHAYLGRTDLRRYADLIDRRMGHALSDYSAEPVLHGLCPDWPSMIHQRNAEVVAENPERESEVELSNPRPAEAHWPVESFFDQRKISASWFSELDEQEIPEGEVSVEEKLGIRPGQRNELLRYGLPWRLARRAFFGGPTEISHPHEGPDVGDPWWIIDPLGYGARLGRGMCAGRLVGFPLTMENGRYQLDGTHVFNHSFEIQSDVRLKSSLLPLQSPQGGLSSLRLGEIEASYPSLLSGTGARRSMDTNAMLAMLWEEVRGFSRQVQADYRRQQQLMEQLQRQIARRLDSRPKGATD